VRRPALLPALGQDAGDGKTLLFCAISRTPGLRRYLKIKLGAKFDQVLRLFDDSDPALDGAKIGSWNVSPLPAITHPEQSARVYELFRNLTESEIGAVAALFERKMPWGRDR